MGVPTGLHAEIDGVGNTTPSPVKKRKRYPKWDNHYKEGRTVYLRRLRKEKKDWLIKELGGRCWRCNGEFESCVYDFHHADGAPEEVRYKHGKRASIPDMSYERLRGHVPLLILLCSNCHRITHHEERNST